MPNFFLYISIALIASIIIQLKYLIHILMKLLPLFLLFATAFICLHAMTIQYNPGYDRLYNLDSNRYTETMLQFQQKSLSDDQNIVFLMRLATTYGFTCFQAGNFISIFNDDETRIQGLQALLNNIIDPQNNATQILNQFTTVTGQFQAKNLLANFTACQTQGDAPDVLPYPVLNYTNTWNDSDVYALIDQINQATTSDQKISIAQTTLLNYSNVLTPNQTLSLFQAFKASNDTITLTNAVNDRFVGLTCEQIQKVLARFLLAADKLNVLTAFKNMVIDAENKYTLLNSFYLPADKDKARLILSQIRPKSPFYGTPSGKIGFSLACSASMATNITLSTGETLTRFQYLKREFEKTIMSFDGNTQFDYGLFGGAPIIWQQSVKSPTAQNIQNALDLFNKRGTGGIHGIWMTYYYLAEVIGVNTIYLITDGVEDMDGDPDPATFINLTKQFHGKGLKVHTIGMLMGDDGKTPEDKAQLVSFLKSLADVTQSTFRILE